MKSLLELYVEHQGKVSDKWSIYISEYDRLFSSYRNQAIRMLEIGIQNGGSLEIWSKYFLDAQVLVGCDINPDCANLTYLDSRINVVVEDANTNLAEAEILRLSPNFDIIIDDGSHTSSDIIKTFARYFRYLNEGGIFVAEDLHCSYWDDFEGGLYYPYSSISFFKRLADIINYEHWGVEKERATILKGFTTEFSIDFNESDLAKIHSIEFFNSVCVVRKRSESLNVLGERIIAGDEELVISGLRKLVASSSSISQSRNVWTAMEKAPDEDWVKLSTEIHTINQTVHQRDEQIASLNKTIHKYNSQIAILQQTIAARDDYIRAIQLSTSWKVTRPIRMVGHQVKRVHSATNLLAPAIKQGGGLKNTFKKAFQLYKQDGISGIKSGFRFVARNGQVIPATGSADFDRNDYAEWVKRYDTLTDEMRVTIRENISLLVAKPLISVVMPTYNPKEEWVIAAIESVRNQIYPHWELCIADDASTDPAIRQILENFVRIDSRIKVVFREKNGHISAASNSALEVCSGDWIALLDHDDLLSEHALFWVADAINQNANIQLIYSDEDKIDDNDRRFDPYFKCDWNLDLFYSHNMISHLGVYKADLIRQVNGFKIGMEGSQDYDLALRCIERLNTAQIHHIPRVLYHWRVHAESTALALDAKPYAMLAGEKALNQHLQRKGIVAKAELVEHGFRIHYALPSNQPKVSLIIPTRNGLKLIRTCVESILKKTTYTNYEIIIIDNGSDDPEVLRFFEKIKTDARVRVVVDNQPFNYSALNNAAVKLAQGTYIGLLNNDLEVITPDWLSEMVSIALQPNVGAVGAKLWYPNNTLQHGGVIIGLGGVAGHAHCGIRRGQPGYFARAKLIQTLSAVTAACLIIKKSTYLQVDGLDETNLKIAFNDVDFCLRVREAGYRNVWTPFAELYHHESASRGFEDTPEKQKRFSDEVLYMQKQWGKTLEVDPAYSPNLTLHHGDFSYAWPPRTHVVLNGINSREDKIFYLLDKKGKGLEIGPSHNPIAPKKKGFDVDILDHASATDLREKYQGHGINLDNIEEVDFVWRGEPLHELIGDNDCYKWIIASHVIEHVPDLISYLQQFEALLEKDGLLSLVVPDKRYCFDHFTPVSTTGDLLDAYINKRIKPSPGQVFDHFSNASKKQGNIAWGADATGAAADALVHTFPEAKALWNKSETTSEYIDVHCWRFTPASFNLIISDLLRLGLINMEVKVEFGTNGCEFYVTLGKVSSVTAEVDRLSILQKIKKECSS